MRVAYCAKDLTMPTAQRLLFPQIRQVVWEPFDLPDQPAPHEILVQARCSLVSAGTELAIYTGTHTNFTAEKPTFQPIPTNPGYALVGHVTAVGDAVNTLYPTLQPGQRVLVQAPHGTAAVVDVRKQPVIALPDGVTDAQGALLRMASIVLTAVRVAPLQLGESVAVYGLGIVGQLVAQLFHLNGAHPIIGVDRIPARLEVAEEHGIIALDGNTTDVATAILQLTAGRGADVVIEATGNPAVVEPALNAAAIGGRVVLLGSTRGPVPQLDVYSLIHRKRVRLIGAHEMAQGLDYAAGVRWSKAENLRLLADLFAAGRLRSGGRISHTIKPADALTIYEQLSADPARYMGVLIDWRQG
jgi:2-desacetyl-2-hydroxyethyl bacteriochlorophyllide A dehydrogenase